MKKVMYHGTQPTILPNFGAIEPGLVELPDELAAALLAAGEKTGDYSDPGPFGARPPDPPLLSGMIVYDVAAPLTEEAGEPAPKCSALLMETGIPPRLRRKE